MNDSPTKVTPKKCIRCGAKSVNPRTGRGRTTRFRTMPTMPIPDIPIPACGHCKSEYIDEATSAALALKFQEVFLLDLRTRVRVAIDILVHHISQRRLEELLGLSQGYLSRLRACVSNPSADLVANLAMLCQDPPTRLAELERFWALPADSWPPPAKPATRTALSPHGYYPRKPKGTTL